ncbi:MAG: hypothetical protein ACW98J_09315 [Candidatus Thorarchaeota archaeon]
MNNKTVIAAGVVFLLALSAMAAFVSAMNTVSATPYLDDSGGDETTVDRKVVPKEIHRREPIEIHRRVPIEIHEDPGSYDDVAGGCGSCVFDIH